VITDLVTVFLARPDFRWLALTNPRLRLCRKRPANGSIWLAMTYGSDGTRTRDLRRGRTALYRRTKDPRRGCKRHPHRAQKGLSSAYGGRRCSPTQGPRDGPLTICTDPLAFTLLIPWLAHVFRAIARPDYLQGFCSWAVLDSNQ
jgi:hypothetical protein